jgi:hypothetical protein
VKEGVDAGGDEFGNLLRAGGADAVVERDGARDQQHEVGGGPVGVVEAEQSSVGELLEAPGELGADWERTGLLPGVQLAGVPLFGLGMGLITPALPVLAAEGAPSQARGRVTAYLSSMMLLGQFASPPVLSSLAGLLGIRAIFVAATPSPPSPSWLLRFRPSSRKGLPC